MYKISVPVMNEHFKRSDREAAADFFRKMGAERIFLALDTYSLDKDKQKEIFSELKENTAFLKECGFEVGAWVWTFWLKDDNNFTHMKFTGGEIADDYICPSDEKFRLFAADYIKEIAKCGVDIIMYDDDYRYGHLGSGIGCLCENHIAFAEALLGEKMPDDGIEKYLLTGGENKYRNAFVSANRHYLLTFAEEMRKSLDEINPDIRFGLCACMSVWDFDGASPPEISEVLAGNTKPFLRLIGAPYWSVDRHWGTRIQDIIELERMERSWCKNENLEIFSEGDAFPRPRHYCPASYIEGFDTALRADGRMDGILKYVLDYTSGSKYETGYINRHIENKKLYEDIEEIFGGKKCIGIRVYEAMRKYEKTDMSRLPDGIYPADLFFSPAARMLSSNCVPSVYEGKGICAMAFGENAKFLPPEAFENGIILDMRAAEILSECGIDTGFTQKNGLIFATEEYFPEYNEYVPINTEKGIYSLTLNKNAEIQSYFINGSEKYPASYIYENSKGQKFFVFAFDGYFMDERLYRQYTRSKQLIQNVKWLSGKSLPASISGNPDLYMMCKAGDGKLSAGLWNFFADYISKPEITLEKEYKKIKFIGCEGTLYKNKVTLSRLDAFGFAGFELCE